MSRDSNTPRHALVCQRPAGRRLQHAALPLALGGLVAGSVWLAADAAAAPAAHHPRPSDTPAQAESTSPDGGSWGGSYAAWRDGDGRNSPDARDSRDGHGHDDRGRYSDRQYSDRHDYARHYADRHYYDWHHGDHGDWRDHNGEHWYAEHSRVVVKRPAAQPQRAASTTADAVAAVHTQAAARPQQGGQAAAPAVAPAAIQHAAHPARRPRSAAAVPPPGSATSISRPDAVRNLSTSGRSNLAAADTADPATDYVTLYGAIGGAALAALLGMGGVAVWRRRGTGQA